MPTPEQVKAALRATLAVGDAIRDAGEIPAGHLYAALMSQGCTLANFDAMIGVLVRAGVVERTQDHLLRWIGPPRQEANG